MVEPGDLSPYAVSDLTQMTSLLLYETSWQIGNRDPQGPNKRFVLH